MRTIGAAVEIFFLFLLLFQSGCEPGGGKLLPKSGGSSNGSVYARYAPVKIDVMPLTEFVSDDDNKAPSHLKAYVSLLDSFDCQVKSPGVFRFELYEMVLRSTEPKGKRVIIWPDVDLTGQAENNKHWRDFLRAYEFNLGFRPKRDQSYILQVTCLCPAGKRLSAEFALEQRK